LFFPLPPAGKPSLPGQVRLQRRWSLRRHCTQYRRTDSKFWY